MNQLQNSVTLIGNLGQDPTKLNTQNSDTSAVAFSIATTDSYSSKNGEKVSSTQWHRCVIFGKKAEVVNQYARKGNRVAVQGQLRYNKFTGKDGVERVSVDIIVNDFMLLEKAEKKAA